MLQTYTRVLFSLKKEILTHAPTWMKHEDIMLNVVDGKTEQTGKCVIPLI